VSEFYDNPNVLSYHFAVIDFGAGDERLIAVPLDGPDSASPGVGKRGRVLGCLIHNVAEAFEGTTSGGGVQVGDGSDADVYYDSGLVLDDDTAGNLDIDVGSSAYLLDDGAQIDIPGGRTDITVTFNVAVGSPTGQADVELFIAWY